MLDQVNDDDRKADEAGPAQGLLFSEDAPGLFSASVDGEKRAYRQNFEEFVRVKIDDPAQIGGNDDVGTPSIRASDKFRWHSQLYVIPGAGGLWRRAANYNNIGEHNDFSDFPF